jgi:phosphotransferase system HPr-like phosphotransfer protein
MQYGRERVVNASLDDAGAARLARIAAEYGCNISVSLTDNVWVNAKDPAALKGLKLVVGASLSILTNGLGETREGEAEVVDRLKRFVACGFSGDS